ncbi:hypothetical protein Godav_002234 [Gossypium davidsonii]|uniref:Retrotransposon gag domain-containing protein n=1 Tax=Gossypium davidsonii TaxID=34287 RepID=A0A7J8SX49_GOSDV|nr:hypothetical protein [Gossypium davidsonii]
MSKEVVDQNEPIQTCGRARKASRSRDMLTALENRVGNLEESVGNMKKTLELVQGRTDGFDSMEEQLREFVLDSLGANAKKINELVNFTTKKLAERDENLEDMVLAMKKEIEELKGELAIYKVVLSNGMLFSRPKQQAMDVPKPEKSIDEKRGGNAIGTWEEFQGELKKLFYLQYTEKDARAKLCRLTEKEVFYWFKDGLKPRAKHELSKQGITELTVAMAEAESFVELGPTKDKFESSKPNGKGNGERNHEKDEERHSNDGNSTDSTSGNRKPRDVKRGSNNPMDKEKRIKCFICQ